MNQLDEKHISRQVARVLGIGKHDASVSLDQNGWAATTEVCEALLEHHDLSVSPDQIQQILSHNKGGPVILKNSRMRLQQKPNRSMGPRPPDILYHATTAAEMERLRSARKLSRTGRKTLYFSHRESHSWRVGHRQSANPRVLYIDTTRAMRHGVRFKKNKRNGLYMANFVPTVDILNLQENFGEQYSAGGFPIRRDDDGKIRLALIKVKRRSGVSWEIAKGKLEPGETPEASACREVAEEMGIENTFRVCRYIDYIRYGFMAPGRLPRLKTVYVYLLESDTPIGPFTPATDEGIQAVQWYTAEEAERLVKHSSLKPIMRRLLKIVANMEANTEREDSWKQF